MQVIASIHSRIVAFSLGSEDFGASTGMTPSAEALLYPKQQMISAARSAGILPLGYVGAITSLDAGSDLAALAHRARLLGSMGAITVHPTQVQMLNVAFSASHSELEDARDLVEAYEKL